MASCCPTTIKPTDFAESKYVPQGNWVSEYFVQGSDSPKKRSVLFIPDIFGFHPETLKVADEIAKRGNYKVYVPEFFEKSAANPLGPWPMDAAPGKDPRWADFLKFITAPSTFARAAAAAKKLTEQDGVPPLCIGMCWGSKEASALAAQSLVACASCPHPSFFNEEDAINTKVPLAVYPSKDENAEDMNKIKAKLEERKLLGDFKVYDSVHHGFAAARFDAKSADCEACREDVIQRTVEFFKKNE